MLASSSSIQASQQAAPSAGRGLVLIFGNPPAPEEPGRALVAFLGVYLHIAIIGFYYF
jgi:hypothetical protein